MVDVGGFLNSDLHASLTLRNGAVLMTLPFFLKGSARFGTQYRISKIAIRRVAS